MAHFSLGIGLAIAAWLLPHLGAGARPWRRWAALPIDITAPLLLFGIVTLALGRPIAAGAATLAIFGGFAFADLAKRKVLGEPVVFSDMSELAELLCHPGLYLPFVGTGWFVAGVISIGVATLALFWFDSPVWPPSVIGAAAVLAVAVAVFTAMGGILLRPSANLLRRLQPSGDPVRDSAVFGPLAMQLVYGVIARAERASRRRLATPLIVARPAPPAGLAPVVVVQSESFFDARRLHADVPENLLPHFSACRMNALQWGRLSVPSWGANTVRTEFAVLTGLAEVALGFDRFNPYHALARVPIAALPWRLRAHGYRTFCVHPFDRNFYRRDIVMPNLGFDVFIGEEAFAGARRNGRYVADIEIARLCEEILREEGNGIFVFAITMENHGPWHLGPIRGASPDFAVDQVVTKDRQEMHNFFAGLRGSDAMLGSLVNTLTNRVGAGLLAFYGDHLPILPRTFERYRFSEPDTDYLLWRPGDGAGTRQDLAARKLGKAILEAHARSRAD